MFFGSRSKRFFCSAKSLTNQSSAILKIFPTSLDAVMERYDESLEYFVFLGFQRSTTLRLSRGQVFVQSFFDLLNLEFGEFRSSPLQHFSLNIVRVKDCGQLFGCVVFSLPAQRSLHPWVSSLLVQFFHFLAYAVS